MQLGEGMKDSVHEAGMSAKAKMLNFHASLSRLTISGKWDAVRTNAKGGTVKSSQDIVMSLKW